MVTDFDISGNRQRSIPGEMKGVSVKGGWLCSHIVPTALPTVGNAEQADPANWAGGWCQITEWLYQDAFTYDSATRNEVPLLIDTPWQSELVAGGVHNESFQPKRILYRNHHVLRAAINCPQNAVDNTYGPDEAGLRAVGSKFKIRRAWLDERSALWYRVTMTNPWIPPETGNRDITIGVTIMGPVCYRITTA
jgi:hypothetical protein